jgi:hypothetical protein
MQVLIYQRAQFEKRLRQFQKAGGKGAQTARRVEGIVRQLCGKECRRPEETAKLTRYGEARIDKCRKLDLGGGYRLIYLKDGSIYVFLFVGTHDACDRWLRRNTGFDAFIEETKYQQIGEVKEDRKGLKPLEASADGAYGDGETLEEELDDRTLRRIFCGLTGERIENSKGPSSISRRLNPPRGNGENTGEKGRTK